MLASVPLSCRLPVPEPVTVTPPAFAAVIVPLPTASVTVVVPAATSRSAIESPLSLNEVSSLVV